MKKRLALALFVMGLGLLGACTGQDEMDDFFESVSDTEQGVMTDGELEDEGNDPR